MNSMLKSKVTEQLVNAWKYERFDFKSALLGLDLHCGFFRRADSAPITKTIYMLHGGNADDTQVAQAGLLPHLAETLGQRNVQIVFPNIGTSFLHDHPTDKKKSFSQYFLNEVIPAAEHGIATKERLICGWSMGGQAAMNMFARHPEHFAGVGAHFPTLVPFDYLNPAEGASYAARMKVTAPMMEILVGEFKKEFIDLKDFYRHCPLTLARENAAAWSDKKIYFDVGSEDEFGLSEGALVLHDILKTKKIEHYFKNIPHGKHDGAFIYTQIANLLNYLL
jgi:S-formylglutathione hydrolase FrmB